MSLGTRWRHTVTAALRGTPAGTVCVSVKDAWKTRGRRVGDVVFCQRLLKDVVLMNKKKNLYLL